MKQILISFFLLIPFLSPAQHRITVNFPEVNPIQGQVYVGLYQSKADFMETEKNFRSCISKVEGSQVQCILENIPNGTYAISVFHDENSNGELDTGMFGIPKEGYGFSKNPRAMFGPPSFEESSFLVEKDVELTIKL